MFPLPKFTSLQLSLQPNPSLPSKAHHPSARSACTKTLMHTILWNTLSLTRWILTPPCPTFLHKRKTFLCISTSILCLSYFSLDATDYIQYTHWHIYQGFYNIACLTMHKHAAGRVAQSKHRAYSETHRPLALLKRLTLGPTPGSHTAPFKASILPGVCQRHADMSEVCSEW